MTKEDLQAKVDSLVWYHRVNLPHGITTPGVFPLYPEFYKLPEDLTGKRVLDIGAYDGYWTFECLKRGAAHVTAIDNFSDAIYPGEKRSFLPMKLCAEALGYKWAPIHSDREICMMEMDLYMLNDIPAPSPAFDVILFFGALYHMRHPLLALDLLRKSAAPGALLCVESHISDSYSPYLGKNHVTHDFIDNKTRSHEIHQGHGEKMVMEFYPGKQLAGCETNWWGPTLRCMGGMMEAAGFKDVKIWKIDQPGELPYHRGFAQGVAG